MEDNNYYTFIIILCIIPVILVVLYNIYDFLSFIFKITRDSFFRKTNYYYHTKEYKKIENILIQIKFVYYLKLNDSKRKEFVYRIEKFIEEKTFIGREGFIINDTVKVYIAACAIQITFGLNDFYLGHFKKIIIYHKEFYSTIKKQHHKGEVNLGGAIVFSWKDFLEGYKNNEDAINLGLHEMAHALQFNYNFNEFVDEFVKHYIQKYLHLSKKEMQILGSGQHHIFRDYAKTNKSEFFAVSVEYFFEKPNLFKGELPILYKEMTILLNQDPLQPNKIGEIDYRLFLDLPKFININNIVIYKTKFNPGSLSDKLLISVIIFIVTMVIGYLSKIESHNWLFYTGIFFVGSFFHLLTSVIHIEVYPDFIVVTSNIIYLSFKKSIIPYDNIISVHIYQDEDSGENQMYILYTDGKKIFKRFINLDKIYDEDVEKILLHLISKNINIKSSVDYFKHSSIEYRKPFKRNNSNY